MSAEWWREYRRRNAEKLRAYNRARRQTPTLKAQRRASEQRRRARLRVEYAPLPALYPDLQHGGTVSFWDDELRLDLAQERALAALTGDPSAVTEYRAREWAWRRITVPLPVEDVAA